MSRDRAEQLCKIMVAFTSKALEDKPNNLAAYTERYFRDLAASRRNNPKLNEIYSQAEIVIMESLEEDSDHDDLTRNVIHRRASIIPENFDQEEVNQLKDDKIEIHPKSESEITDLSRRLVKSYLFRDLPLHEIRTICKWFYPLNVKAGEIIIHQGDTGKKFYVVGSGRFHAIKNGKIVHTYENDGCFGELALLYNQSRSATVQAVTRGILWVIEGRAFRKLIRNVAIQTRTLYTSFLDNVVLFEELNEQERFKLADALSLAYYNDGECIFNQGELASCMYFVKEGSVRIVMNVKGRTELIKTCKIGDYFGELALIIKRPRAASAFAVGDVVLAKLDVDVFEGLFGKCEDIMKRNIKKYETVIRNVFAIRMISSSAERALYLSQ
ncbi:hypothetical protein GJ496_010837 [Pomphorhynchus laevis]|nr:hypothetical protein GJ496_010837 [Pomphorhynchus laevis]